MFVIINKSINKAKTNTFGVQVLPATLDFTTPWCSGAV
uniref:Uncharacterized protein n=1 Tax=Lotus japonicus TaxID=34305 RepID=I3T3P6_LOTJA|nr:unknown [Lotus japonicus]